MISKATLVLGTFTEQVLFDKALEGPQVVRVLAVDQRKSTQRPEIFFAIGGGGLGHSCEVRERRGLFLFFFSDNG
jgi:hypothetical protein